MSTQRTRCQGDPIFQCSGTAVLAVLPVQPVKVVPTHWSTYQLPRNDFPYIALEQRPGNRGAMCGTDISPINIYQTFNERRRIRDAEAAS
jgi:hypothetical protein